MSLLARVGLAVLLAATLFPQALARDETRPNQEQALVAFTSDEGIARFARAVAKVDFPVLANQFEAQSNTAFCGPATAAMVLNAVRGRSRDLPVIAAACVPRTISISRADSIRQSRVSRKIT